MPHAYAIAAFLAAILPLVATPGASLTLLIQKVTATGRRQAAVPVILGTVTGLYVHAALAVVGLSAIVMRSSQAFTAVRLAGAAYLVALGIWTWRGARARARARATSRPGPGRSTYLQALLANVLNPKAASIFLTLVPQFLDPARPLPTQILILATAQAALITCWLLTWTTVITHTTRVLRAPRFKTVLTRVTAGILVALGLRTAAAAAAAA
jgi:threonine/homoserine/homoserine lactone efflux protein